MHPCCMLMKVHWCLLDCCVLLCLPSCLRPLQDNMVIDDFKYSVKVIRRAPFIFNVQLNKSNVDVVARKLGDGGFLLQVRKREQRFCRKAAAMTAVVAEGMCMASCGVP